MPDLGVGDPVQAEFLKGWGLEGRKGELIKKIRFHPADAEVASKDEWTAAGVGHQIWALRVGELFVGLHIWRGAPDAPAAYVCRVAPDMAVVQSWIVERRRKFG